MVKGFGQIASLTALSRVFGLVRDVAYSHFFGANQLLDAWIIAFRIPNLSRRLFGEGAASASLIPVYSETLHADKEQAAILANSVVTVMFVILAGLVLLGEGVIWLYYAIFARTSETTLILSLSSVMLPYMLFVCMVAVIAGLLNVHRHFAAPAAAPLLLNIFIIASVVITGWFLHIEARAQLFYIAVAVLLAGVGQIGMQVPALKRCGLSLRPAWEVRSEQFRKILVLMGPMILGLTVTQINTLADDLIAWWFSSSPEKGAYFELFGKQIAYPMERGSVSHLYYAQRLYQLPLGVLGISLATAIFPVMSENVARKDFAALRATIARGIRGTVFIAIPATMGLVLVARPLISAAFEHGKFDSEDTMMVTRTLCFYAAGLSGYFAQQILARAFYSMQDSRTPMHSALAAVSANCVLNLTLIWYLDRAGLACATAICSYVQVLILIAALRKRVGPTILDGLPRTAAKTVAATMFMGAVGMAAIFLMNRLPAGRIFDIIRLAAVVPLSAGAYLLAAKLLRIEMLSIFSRRRRRNV
ncbi:MAG: murein biosynthesis integral membrane protein MurJ [Sedimentisphaerales bacterium]|nr:murein biosynthesis integral membrane protein MurJ [Sedimentisphaerales bacterium]